MDKKIFQTSLQGSTQSPTNPVGYEGMQDLEMPGHQKNISLSIREAIVQKIPEFYEILS